VGYGAGGGRAAAEKVLESLRPGVTELLLHPAIETAELCAFADDWPTRVDDHRLLTTDDALREAVERHGITLIGYEPLRELQRSA
jgi:hypothetical protein